MSKPTRTVKANPTGDGIRLSTNDPAGQEVLATFSASLNCGVIATANATKINNATTHPIF